ncbi:uroporphyrinogen-III C-methyltransferase [Aeromicrobium sp. CF3.5]|uniref:uroporphyrinogen-III C-methyltransferase n=1 Tax=Aeromicrobium sp. CF3.5 TaxID=3373078 RepID=UPI003EE5ADF3
MDGLPLLLDLTDRRVLAVGGGPVSARRVQALVEAGAAVHLVSPIVCEDLADLVDAGRVRWSPRDVVDADLDDVWLVHTATGDLALDAHVSRGCTERRIWCVNATDQTAATAHVPARHRVDTPDGPVDLAVNAGDPRRAVSIRNRLAEVLATEVVPAVRHRPRDAGWVALVGGGPGDEGLVTQRAYHLLSTADVVVTDRLGPRSLLDRLPETVRVIDVGKTPGHHPVPQHEINQILVDEANAGHGVVRLKGGDPYVLGRGAEERLACEQAGVDVEVVPGVTSAIAVPAAAGIPITHRGLSRGFTVVTGHDQLGDLPAGTDHTLVVLMGVTTLSSTTADLITNGRDARCPVAVIERGCTPEQRVTVGDLSTIADRAQERGVTSPAVIVIGDVVTLSPAWAIPS